MEYDTMILKTHFISLWGVSKCIFHALYASTFPLSDHFVTEQQQTVRKNWWFYISLSQFYHGEIFWCHLLLGHLSGFVGRFEINMLWCWQKNYSCKYSRIDLRLDRMWRPLTQSDDPTQWDLGSNQTWKGHVWIQIEICSQLLWLVSFVWPLEELVHGLEVLCAQLYKWRWWEHPLVNNSICLA